jgi:hypothetical protein
MIWLERARDLGESILISSPRGRGFFHVAIQRDTSRIARGMMRDALANAWRWFSPGWPPISTGLTRRGARDRRLRCWHRTTAARLLDFAVLDFAHWTGGGPVGDPADERTRALEGVLRTLSPRVLARGDGVPLGASPCAARSR